MNAALHRLEFVGGPFDGMVLRDAGVEVQSTMRWPAGAATLRRGERCFEIVGYWSSSYRVASRRQVNEAGRVVDRLRYEFAGYELSNSWLYPQPPSRRAWDWISVAWAWLMRLPRRAWSWLTEPISPPLNILRTAAPRVNSPMAWPSRSAT